ncbi:NUDIX hydrolase [bacterium]|nr:NUDIX hydrolase [bacterium]
MKEKVIESQIVFQGRLLKVEVDKVELENGVISTREVVVHRGAVAILPILYSGDIVLVRQFRLPANKVLLEIPAGTLSPGEEPLECAKRELEEETGYRAGKWNKLVSLFLAPGYSTECIHIFCAEELTMGEKHADEDEVISSEIVPFSKALEMVFNNEIEDAKTACAILFYNALKERRDDYGL